MSYVTWIDEDPWAAVRWHQRSPNATCTWVTPPDIGSPHWTRYHEVTSWRGKREELRVGSKRRQLFRRFEVRKQELINEGSTWLWCPAPGKVCRGVNLPPARLLNTWKWIEADSSHAAWAGTKMPVYSYEEHQAFAEKYRDELVMDLYVKAKEPRYDSAVFLAELGETLVSITGLFLSSIKAYKKAARLKLLNKPSRKMGSAVGNAISGGVYTAAHLTLNSEELWLWYRYFLLPAMLDAQEMLEAIKPQAKIDRIQTGMSKKTFNTTGTVYANGWWGAYNYEIPWSQTLTVSGGCAMDITKRLDPAQWGTSAIDCLRASWEIIPFSFVFDWFVSMGDFLTTLRDVELEIAQSYATFAIESEITLHAGPDVYQTYDPKIRTVAIKRLVDLDQPWHPMVNNSWFNTVRTVDSLALATGILKGILKRGKTKGG